MKTNLVIMAYVTVVALLVLGALAFEAFKFLALVKYVFS